MSTIQTERTEPDESDLQQKLKKVEYDTLDGDTCRAEIVDIHESYGDIEVTVELPSGRTHTESFDIPQVASDDYEIVRLLEETGYALSTIDHAEEEGAEVRVEITDNGPNIVIPEPDRGVVERAHSVVDKVPDPTLYAAGVTLAALTLPISSWPIYKSHHQTAWGYEAPTIETFFVWVIATLCWGASVGFIGLVLGNMFIW